MDVNWQPFPDHVLERKIVLARQLRDGSSDTFELQWVNREIPPRKFIPYCRGNVKQKNYTILWSCGRNVPEGLFPMMSTASRFSLKALITY